MRLAEILRHILVGDPLGEQRPEAANPGRYDDPYGVRELRAEVAALREQLRGLRAEATPTPAPAEPSRESDAMGRINVPRGAVARVAAKGERAVIIRADGSHPFELGKSYVVTGVSDSSADLFHPDEGVSYEVRHRCYAVVDDRWTRKIPEGKTVFDAVDAERAAEGQPVPAPVISPEPGVYGDPSASFPGNLCVPPPTKEEVEAALISLVEKDEKVTKAALRERILMARDRISAAAR